MSERHDIVLSQDGGSPQRNRMVRLVRAFRDAAQWINKTLRPQQAVEQIRDDGLRLFKGKADE